MNEARSKRHRSPGRADTRAVLIAALAFTTAAILIAGHLVAGHPAPPLVDAGPLSPPGIGGPVIGNIPAVNLGPDPQPFMKTLHQAEPRRPIDVVPFIITESGSYFLASNLDAGFGGGIAIQTSNVTIDLNGFTVTGGSPATIEIPDIGTPGYANIVIRNGTLRESNAGILGFNVRHLTVESVSFAQCDEGVRLEGGDGADIGSCAFIRCVRYGVIFDFQSAGWVHDCVFYDGCDIAAIAGGIGTRLTRCVTGDTGGDGIRFIQTEGAVAEKNLIFNPRHAGIDGGSSGEGTLVRENLVFRADPGIDLSKHDRSRIQGNLVNDSDTAIAAGGSGSITRIESNHVFNGSITSGGLVFRNTVSGTGAGYSIGSGAIQGPLHTSAGAIGSSNGWENFLR